MGLNNQSNFVLTIFDFEMITSMAHGIVDDMQAGLFRSGYSSIIRESHDASCAVLLDDGSLAAQKGGSSNSYRCISGGYLLEFFSLYDL